MKKKNIWKYNFTILLVINLIIIIAIVFLIFTPGKDTSYLPPIDPPQENTAEFIIKTDKKDLNQLINHYIDKEGLNGPIHYQVILTDEVELYGEVQVFSQSLQFKMTFEPQALENGDLLLEQKSLSLGGIKLPVTYVLKIIKDAYSLPEWVMIHPQDKQIYVALQQMRLNNGIQVRAKDFNLAENNIEMKMLVPVKIR